jgi:GxxExxY protein
MDENTIAACVINRALEIHKEVGPGLLESIYEVLLADALEQSGFRSNGRSQFLFTFAGSASMKAFERILLSEGRFWSN